jgi:hypothetical protein
VLGYLPGVELNAESPLGEDGEEVKTFTACNSVVLIGDVECGCGDLVGSEVGMNHVFLATLGKAFKREIAY